MSESFENGVEQQAALAFLRSLLRSVCPEAVSTHLEPTSFAALSDAKALYLLLSRAAPSAFRNVDEMVADLGERGRTNRPLRKEHLWTLLNDMNAFANSSAVTRASGASGELIVLDVDIAVVAGSATLMGVTGDANDEDVEEQREAFHELTKLVMAAVALLVLSGALASEADAAMNELHAGSAQALRLAVEAVAARCKLAPNDGAHMGTTHSDPNSGAAPSPAAQDVTSSTVTGASVAAATNLMDSAAALSGADDSYFRNATVQLRRELEEVKGRLTEAELQLRRTKESEESWERRYRMLLDEQNGGGRSPASSSASAAANASGNVMSGPEVADWKQRLASKEELIQTLVKKVEEQTTTLKAFKEATAAQEQGLYAMKRKLKSTEEGLMAKAAERREALERLAIAEDKLAIQIKAKHELENEVEELRSQVTILRLTQQQNADAAGDDTKLMNSSFASNGSIDRVMQLENELDDARMQREALQKQLFILQKQVTANATPLADVGAAANDTLKAQIRHLEKERENIQQQLATALGRVEELQTNLSDSAGVTGSGAVLERSPRGLPGHSATTPASRAAAAVRDSSVLDTSTTGLPSPDDTCVDETGAKGTDVNDLPTRLRKLRDNTRREHAMLSSLLLQYGYKNLMQQQHQVLLHAGSGASEESAKGAVSPYPETSNSPATNSNNPVEGVYAGSYLARQRREVEQGLLESIIHANSDKAGKPEVDAARQREVSSASTS